MPLHIPEFWASVTGSARNTRDEDVALKCFGHSDSGVPEARAQARTTLTRLIERVRAGAPWPDRYGYGDRPIREEIFRELRSPADSLDGYLTRNGYGATVLNSAGLLFGDIDDVPVGRLGRLRRLFRSRAPEPGNPHGIPSSVLAFEAAVRPAHEGATVLPREDPALEQAHQRWLRSYVAACEKYATCRFVTVLGRGRSCADAERLVLVHDEATRAGSALPLA